MTSRRILGIETEYGVTCVVDGQRRLSPDEVARYLFRRVVAWGRSSNVFLPNGGRLYLDVGSHPEYATAECDSLSDLIAQEQAGDRIIEDLVIEAEARLNNEGTIGQIHIFKNNTDSVGNSYGCHENYSIERKYNFESVVQKLVPFLITRQIFTGAGKWTRTSKEGFFQISQRAEHMWESISSATTRSRPIINTRDEPHADPELYRRLHVIVGDSNMSQCTTALKVVITELVLRVLENTNNSIDLELDNPIRAIRDISTDLDFKKLVKLTNGKELTALQIQKEYFSMVEKLPDLSEILKKPIYSYAFDLWKRSIESFERMDLADVELELDWIIKKNYIEQYKHKNNITELDPKLELLDISYHNIRRDRGIFYILENAGLVKSLINDQQIQWAQNNPPATTRAALRGRFIREAQDKKRDFTVDWVHLKINDQNQKTVVCQDPFLSVDKRVDDLIASL